MKKLLQKVSGERGFLLEEVSIHMPVHSATEVRQWRLSEARREGREVGCADTQCLVQILDALEASLKQQ